MTTAAVLDTSAVIALLRNEPGAEKVTQQLSYPCLISSVNYAEVLYVWKRKKPLFSWGNLLELVEALQLEIIPFNDSHAKVAALIKDMSMSFGLSLGDAACLALTREVGLPVFTAERSWTALPFKADIDIRLIR